MKERINTFLTVLVEIAIIILLAIIHITWGNNGL
jgi:hypothetical protein